MPRRNIYFLLAIGILALVCYQKVQTNPDGQILADSLDIIEHLALYPVEPSALFEGAMDGMVNRLDEHSSYISPEELAEFTEALDQQFGGTGMIVAVDPKTRQLMVVNPLLDSPAFKAGVRGGDKILRIGEHSAQGMSVKDASSLLRGKPGDSVTISILHEGESKPLDISIVRAVVQIDTVLGDTRNANGSWNYFLEGKDRVGYVRIESFGEKTAEDVQKAVQGLVDHDMQGLILDLRDNPGGYLSAAEKICDLFISSGTIVTTRDRNDAIVNTWRASGKGPFTKFPLVVLVNQFSASASEITAACLQDHDRAEVVGQRTWGKGTVQGIIDLEENHGAMKITMASYWRPSNRNIHRRPDAGENDEWGVRPNHGCEVTADDDELTQLRLWRARRDVPNSLNGGNKTEAEEKFIDRQLAKALELLEKKSQ